jgi:predicted MFS family arabinose efflux permease
MWSLGTVMTGYATGFASLLAYRILVGLGEASYATISPSLLADSYGPSKRNNALTVFYAAIPVGAAIGYALGAFIEVRWGWRSAFIFPGLPGLALAVCLLPFREPARGQSDGAATTSEGVPGLASTLRLLRLPDYNLVVWGYVAYTFAMGAFAFWGPAYLMRVYQMGQEQAGNYFGTVTAVAGLLSTFAGGFAATAWRKRNPAAYSLTLGLSTLAAVPFAAWAFLGGTEQALMYGLAAALFLLFLGTGPVNTLIVETVPVTLRASAMALSIFMIHLFGDFWSPEIIGYLPDTLGNVQKADLILPPVLLAGGALWLALGVKTLRSSRNVVCSIS